MRFLLLFFLSVATSFGALTATFTNNGAAGISFVGTGTGVVSRTIDKEFNEIGVNVMRYGAKGDGVTDDTNAINLALAYACAVKGKLIFPAGRFKTRGGHLITDSIKVVGAGMGVTIIEYDQANKAGICFWRGRDLANETFIESVTFEDMTINGTWLTTQNEINEASAMDLYYVKNLNYRNLEVTNCCFMALKGNWCQNVSIVNCHVEKATRDAFNFENCSDFRAIGGSVKHCHDDAIAVSMSSEATAPIRKSITITGFTVIDSLGFDVMGAKNLTITGNDFRLCRGRAAKVGFSTEYHEGETSAFNVTITSNTVSDVMHAGLFNANHTEHCGFLIESYPPSTGGTLANIPLLNNTGTGAIIPYFNYLDLNGVSASTACAGGFFFNVSNNVITRTIPDATKYSDMGYGLAFAKTGFFDPAFTHVADSGNIDTDSQDFHGIRISNSLRNSIIANNVISSGNRGITFTKSGLASNDFFFHNLVIQGNIIYRCRGGGIGNNFTADTFVGITVRNNFFDIDPLFESTRRTAGGTWNTGLTTPFAIDLSYMKGVQLGGNEYRNCIQMVKTSANTLVSYIAPEIPHCKPVVTGKHNTNIGIGTCPSAGQGKYQYVIEEGDPTSTNFLQTLNVCVNEAAACPESGIYVAGHFVKNNAPAVANGKIVTGWMRLTTGSGHNKDTGNNDWATCEVTSP